MSSCRTAAVAVVLVFSCFCTACGSMAELQPEQPATIHVGDLAALRVDADRHDALGSAGTSLTLIRRAETRGTTVYVYRAIAPGRQTVVLTPRDPGADGCISCVTARYFITVVR